MVFAIVVVRKNRVCIFLRAEMCYLGLSVGKRTRKKTRARGNWRNTMYISLENIILRNCRDISFFQTRIINYLYSNDYEIIVT